METVFKLLDIEDIIIHFQPIISIKRKQIIGVEALCRGINKNKIIPPNVLFSRAREKKINIEFDRLCREKSLEYFSKIYKKNNKLMLFLNHDSSILDEGVVSTGYTNNTTKQKGLPPENIVIEISEKKVSNTAALKEFVETYKNYGFLIALDDVGASYSNLNRIPELKPDILKIDRSLIADVDKIWRKSKVLKSFSFLSKEIGTLIIAEGVEKKEEVLQILKFDIDIFQGFYFAKPGDPSLLNFDETVRKTINLSSHFQNSMVDIFRKKRKQHQHYKKIISKIINSLLNEIRVVDVTYFEQKLKEIVEYYPDIECAYIIDNNGIQITDTIFHRHFIPKARGPLYRPAQKGDDLCCRDYFFYLINCNISSYVTDQYISLATGNKCVTISNLFKKDNNKFILCVDIKIDDI
ncbi:EAL domain-containing protein [Desulfohalobiaceae bacterium Ax17]|uniref:EAL domain-containing protein n=1 Tax=Desulfovulcanus ferrireducens TaxID=2831190 RepID=UPI00207BB1CC|nr:EAL domain-containing protein [Desulfovulcanus ferrireducens]MBT8763457.1 EAL domain-containing protein [Desulfovulcanus ferrireducens]